MADTNTSTVTLGVGLEYTDTETQKTKTVYLKMEDPKTNLTEERVKTAVQNLISGEAPILLTPDEEKFDTATAIATAYIERIEKTEFDIGVS